jgi:hypothetical protein
MAVELHAANKAFKEEKKKFPIKGGEYALAGASANELMAFAWFLRGWEASRRTEVSCKTDSEKGRRFDGKKFG